MKKVMFIVAFIFMASIILHSQTYIILKPDLTIVKIEVTRTCHLAVVVRNNGPGKLPDMVYTKSHPKSAGVYIYINGKPWGGQTIKGFDPARKLQKPGGQATYVSNYKASISPIKVGAIVDLHNDVKEENERNNRMIRNGVRCRVFLKLPDLGMYGFLKVGKRKREVKWNKTIVLTPEDVDIILGGKKKVDLYYSFREYNGVAASGFTNKMYFHGGLKGIQRNLSVNPKQIISTRFVLYWTPNEGDGKVQIKIDADNDVRESREDNNFHFYVTLKYKSL